LNYSTEYLRVQGKGRHSFPSGHYDEAVWDQGLRHGPATYFHPNGNKAAPTITTTYVAFNLFGQKGFVQQIA
jgi:hypothetical protein